MTEGPIKPFLATQLDLDFKRPTTEDANSTEKILERSLSYIKSDIPKLATALERPYSTFAEAFEAIDHEMALLVPDPDEMFDTDENGDFLDTETTELYTLTELRRSLFLAIRAKQPLSLGLLAATVSLYGPERRNIDFEHSFELDYEESTQPADDPYNALPRLALEQAQQSTDLEQQLAYVKIVDSILGILQSEVQSLNFRTDDGFEETLFRQNTVDFIENALTQKGMISMIAPDIDFFPYLRWFVEDKEMRNNFMKGALHFSERFA